MYYSDIEMGAVMNLQLMRLRKEAGYKSRKVIADALGISERKYKSWETEEVRLTLDDACDIADLLDCTLDELAGRDFQPTAYSDPRQQALNHSYSLLDERSKGDLAGIASTFTADPSRLAAKSGQDSEPLVAEEGAA